MFNIDFVQLRSTRTYLERVVNVFLGIGSILDIYPSSKKYGFHKEILNISDSEAIRQDWFVVGNDIRIALRKITNDIKTHD